MNEEWTEVGEWSSLDQADEHALVALSMRSDCRVMPKAGTFSLEVAPEAADPVRRELEVYAGEQEEAPRRLEESVQPAGLALAFGWALVLAVVHAFREADPSIVNRWANDAARVWSGGEWWRAFTALFLHADGAHLLGNLLIGGAFCVMVATVLGPLRGWVLILASGFAGNLLTGWIHHHLDEPFRSLGASTATFGALGILVGAGVVRAWRERRYRALKPLIAPLAVGFSLLGMFGVGGVDTDVLGHLCGWGAGIFFGWLAATFAKAEAAGVGKGHSAGLASSGSADGFSNR